MTLVAGAALPAWGQKLHLNRTYGRAGGEAQTMDVAVPRGLGRFPAILFVHGGTWMGGSKEMHLLDAYRVAQRGFVGATINYRLAPGHRFPAQLEDVKGAVGWLKAHAGAFQIDPSRVAIVGQSAGGHLAFLHALRHTDPLSRVQAAVNWSGPTDLNLWHATSPDFRTSLHLVFPTMLGASPIRHLSSRSPPLLSLHGLDDEAVPYHQALLFGGRALAVGAPHTLRTYPGEKHLFTPLGREKAFQAILGFADRILKE